MTDAPMTLRDFTGRTCDTPGCDCGNDELTLHGRCHLTAPSTVTFMGKTGTLVVTCSECGQFIAEIAVAP